MNRQALAHFLRRHRERLRPADVGLPERTRGRRRTPGLRREEIAALAEVSVNYYERLEQARGPRPSPQVLGALADALRLGKGERRYLAGLAGQQVVPDGDGPCGEVPVGVRTLLERLPDQPAYVLDAKYDVLAWNAAVTALIADFARLARRERNVLRLAFGGTDRSAVVRVAGCSSGPEDTVRFLRQAVAELRQAQVRYPADTDIPALIDWLLARDTDFAGVWEEHQVRAEVTLWKSFEHPVVGRVELDGQTLQVPECDQRLVIYSAEPGGAAHGKLRRLLG